MQTITSSKEISRCFDDSKKYNAGSVSIICHGNGDQHDRSGRVAFIAGKKLGNAVWRNRSKRRLRALARELGAPWDGYDVLFVARRSTADCSWDELRSSATRLLRRAGFDVR